MFDTLPTLFTVVALYLSLERRFALAGVALALATVMKYYALTLMLPALILAWMFGGRKSVAILIASMSATTSLLLLPLLSQSISAFVGVTSAPYPAGIHYSGLSLWTALTLFYPNFDQTYVSVLLLVASVSTVYILAWKMRSRTAQFAVVSFALPILFALLFYKFVGENYFVWLLPFASLLVSKHVISRKSYWILSFVGLLSSLTDSLLPYYMLPISPWIGGFLIHVLSFVSPYKVGPQGSIVQGLSAGKLFLSALGLLSTFLISWIIYQIVSGQLREGRTETLGNEGTTVATRALTILPSPANEVSVSRALANHSADGLFHVD
jgi:hypothetical protein